MVLFAIIRSRCGWDLRWRGDSAPPSDGNLSEIGIANRSILPLASETCAPAKLHGNIYPSRRSTRSQADTC